MEDIKKAIKELKERFLEKCEEMKSIFFLTRPEHVDLLNQECDQMKQVLTEKIARSKIIDQQQEDEVQLQQQFIETLDMKLAEAEAERVALEQRMIQLQQDIANCSE